MAARCAALWGSSDRRCPRRCGDCQDARDGAEECDPLGTRSMAREMGLSQTAVQPHLARLRPATASAGKRSSSRPVLFVDKVRDIVGLYLDPPLKAWCCASMGRPRSGARPTQPITLAPGTAERQAHDYMRHGTTTLFAARFATGEVIRGTADAAGNRWTPPFCAPSKPAWPGRSRHPTGNGQLRRTRRRRSEVGLPVIRVSRPFHPDLGLLDQPRSNAGCRTHRETDSSRDPPFPRHSSRPFALPCSFR